MTEPKTPATCARCGCPPHIGDCGREVLDHPESRCYSICICPGVSAPAPATDIETAREIVKPTMDTVYVMWVDHGTGYAGPLVLNDGERTLFTDFAECHREAAKYADTTQREFVAADQVAAALTAAREQGKAEGAPRWIPVTERLPEVRDGFNDVDVFVMKRSHYGELYPLCTRYDPADGGFDTENVELWMYPPKLPAGVELIAPAAPTDTEER